MQVLVSIKSQSILLGIFEHYITFHLIGNTFIISWPQV